MTDMIIKQGNSIIQHGMDNDRIYLMKLAKEDFPQIIRHMDDLAKAKIYGKIFAKIPAWAKKGFEQNGYRNEALIPNFYMGKEDACFMAKYFDPARAIDANERLIHQIITQAQQTKPLETAPYLKGQYTFSKLQHQDVSDMVFVYKNVFATYPFPIHDADYLKETMDDHIVYFGIKDQGTLIAIASCETDSRSQSVEMTDFATLPEYRSKGLASYLLAEMGNEMKQQKFRVAYTIARSLSPGMNITFAKNSYIFAGTLINNTNISGKIESMNVWYKPL